MRNKSNSLVINRLDATGEFTFAIAATN